MRILWITNTLFPEAERLLTGKGELRTTGGWMIGAAEALMSYNNTQLAVATVSTFVKSLQVLRGHKIIYYVFPLGKGNFKYNPEYEKYWRKIKDDYRPDIVHIHGTEFTHGLSYIKTCGNHNAVVSIQGLKSLYANYYRGDISLIDIIKTSTLRDFVKGGIVSGQHRFRQAGKYELEMLKSVEHIIGRTSWDKSFVWANCPNATYHFCNETLRSEFYSGMRWSEEKCERHTIFVSQGTYPIKGLHKLLDAMPIILSYYPDAKVRIAGNDLTKPRKVKGISVLDGYGNYIKKKITRLKLSTSVDFVGNLNAEEMIKEYLNANVFVSPSAIENSPNSLGEAQILGVPCISSYVGGAPDMMIGNEQNLYRYEETNMLANKICSIFQNADKEKLDLMQKIAAERHSKTNNAEETMKIYVGIVNKCKWGGR